MLNCSPNDVRCYIYYEKNKCDALASKNGTGNNNSVNTTPPNNTNNTNTPVNNNDPDGLRYLAAPPEPPILSLLNFKTGWQVVFENHFEDMIPSTEPNVLINALFVPRVPASLTVLKTFLTPIEAGQSMEVALPISYDGNYTVSEIKINGVIYNPGDKIVLKSSNDLRMVFVRSSGLGMKLKLLIK